MIAKLQKRFVRIAMLSVLLVMLLLDGNQRVSWFIFLSIYSEKAVIRFVC